MNLNNIYIIVVDPRTKGNIGSIARAMKNMGFRNLYLINPVKYKDPETYWMGWGAKDIIDKAKVFESFDKAVAKMKFLIATTQRPRKRRNPFYSVKEIIPFINEAGKNNKIGIVFGREDNGLTNEEIEKCNIISTIPHNSDYPSLNLAQAVMVYCYEIFQSKKSKNNKYKWELASKESEEKLYGRIYELLKKKNFKFCNSNDHFIGSLRRIGGRISLEERDIKLLHKLLDVIFKYSENRA